jgi:hypothetical protein
MKNLTNNLKPLYEEAFNPHPAVAGGYNWL